MCKKEKKCQTAAGMKTKEELEVLLFCMQRHWPGAVWKAADGGRPASAVSGLQKPAAGRSCPLCAPDLPPRRPCGLAAPGCGLCAVSAACCSGDQGQVLTPRYRDRLALFMFSQLLFLETECGIEYEESLMHIYVFRQVQQNWLSVSQCRNYAQSTSEHQSFIHGSVLQVKFKNLLLLAQCSNFSFSCNFLISSLTFDSCMPVLSNVSCPCCYIMVYAHCRNVIHMFATAEGLLTQQDLLNSDGLQEVFATNLFGHFLLVRYGLHTHMKSKRWDLLSGHSVYLYSSAMLLLVFSKGIWHTDMFCYK